MQYTLYRFSQINIASQIMMAVEASVLIEVQMKNKYEDLIQRINNLKDILNEVLSLENINSDEVIDISKELDHLIVEYFRLINEGIG